MLVSDARRKGLHRVYLIAWDVPGDKQLYLVVQPDGSLRWRPDPEYATCWATWAGAARERLERDIWTYTHVHIHVLGRRGFSGET